jgi:SAM-dependent methyltransferase
MHYAPLSPLMESEQNKLPDYALPVEKHALTLAEEGVRYWYYHRQRYVFAVELLQRLTAASGQPPQRVLDIGPSFQTLLLEAAFPEARIDTMGFANPDFRVKGPSLHIDFDLNDAFYREKWPAFSPEKYDLLVMLEVIEHLYTSPRLVFSCLREALRPGGLLVVQTPNAVSLAKRYRMMKGRNPYDLIRESRANPGHFREYTVPELRSLAESAGFSVKKVMVRNYFANTGLLSRLSAHLWSNLREGITLVLKRP